MIKQPTFSQDEIATILIRVARKLAPKFKFGYHSVEDMQQQAHIEALKAIPKFDLAKAKSTDRLIALENFLYSHVHNRLFNFKRDNYMRPKQPCRRCRHFADEECVEHEDVGDCPILTKWIDRNKNRQNIIRPIPLENVENDEKEQNMRATASNTINTISGKELITLLNRELDPLFRQDFTRFLYGLKLPKTRRLALLGLIREVLVEHGYTLPDMGDENE